MSSSESKKIERLTKKVFPKAKKRYNKQGYPYYEDFNQYIIGWAQRKNGFMVYLMPIYCFPEIEIKYRKDIQHWRSGKSCLKFKSQSEINVPLISRILKSSRPLFRKNQKT